MNPPLRFPAFAISANETSYRVEACKPKNRKTAGSYAVNSWRSVRRTGASGASLPGADLPSAAGAAKRGVKIQVTAQDWFVSMRTRAVLSDT